MRNDLFKFRGRFDFSPNPFEIGRPVFRDKGSADNFFLLKIYDLPQTSYDEFYCYHLKYFIDKYPGEERYFHECVNDIVTTRIKYYQSQNPFSKKHSTNIRSLESLGSFRNIFSKHDKWNSSTPISDLLIEKDFEIEHLRTRIKELEGQIKECLKYEPSEKISISRGNLATFMDLLRQIRTLQLPNGTKMLTAQGYSSAYKMVSKYFAHGDKDIPFGTAQNYLSPDTSSKYIEIAEKDKIFQITLKHL